MLRRIAWLLWALALLGAVRLDGKVLVDWDFTKADALNGAIPLTLRGTSRLDGGLVAMEADRTKPSGAESRSAGAALSPAGAFSLEISFVLDARYQRPKGNSAMLLDTKYVAMPKAGQEKLHRGFQVSLRPAGKDRYTPVAAFGFGASSAQVSGKKGCTLKPGVPHTLKMVFTGTGKVSFELDGADAGEAEVPGGPIAPSRQKVAVGDRSGSLYHSLGGKVLRLRLSEERLVALALEAVPGHRQVFERGETNRRYFVRCVNRSAAPYNGLTLHTTLAGKALPPQSLPSALAPGAEKVFEMPVDTLLLPGDYALRCRLADASGKNVAEEEFTVTIVPAYGDFLPVILWGRVDDAAEVRRLGFTHQHCNLVPSSQNGKPDVVAGIAALDRQLRHGLYTYTHFNTRRFTKPPRYIQANRAGKPNARLLVDASRPEVVQEMKETATQVAEAFGDHPAWDVALLNSEVKGHTAPSFNGPQPANFRRFAGYDIPVSIIGKSPMPYAKDTGFPWNRIVGEARPDLVFLRWFWRQGDGWNALNSAITATLHQHIHRHFFTFTDPAVREPPLWGSGGTTDMISQWVYTNPDPLNIGMVADEMIAMAAGRPGQKVGMMTQAIWYRRAAAPFGRKVANPPEWLAREREAKFISIPPDFLRAALWYELARRLDAVMYHGAGSLVQPNPTHSYRYTNAQSKEALAQMCAEVVRPLGPMLKRVPERSAEIGILESVTSCLYSSRHFSMGWGKGWICDLAMALHWNGLSPAIFYEEHLLHGKMPESLRVLFVPACDVLPSSVLAKLQELQRKGVILVGDEYTTPALMLDLRLQSVPRLSDHPRETKAALQRLGAKIAAVLKPYYQPPMKPGNPDLVMRRRGTDAADYLFVVNDRRTFGDYIGQWGMVMEKGLPNAAAVTVAHPCAAVYDLVKHRQVTEAAVADGATRIPVRLGPCEGTLLLLLDRPIDAVRVTPPAKMERGQAFEVGVQIAAADGTPIPAILPVEVTLADSAGHRLPGSGYYAAENGRLVIRETAATNMAIGKVTCTAKCLASGKTAHIATVAQ